MPSKNIPVNGWPQIKDLDIAAPILSELDKIETWQKSVKQETKSGAYVEFTNALALDASSVIAEITAEQDLHGYDKPWAGGAGKNLLPMTVEGIKAANSDYTWSGNSCTISGITITILTDSNGNVNGISANGTATDRVLLFITRTAQYTSGETYILNGCPSGGSLSTYLFYIVDGGEQYDVGTGVTFTSTGSANRLVLIMVRQGVTIDKVFYPMIRLATETDATFAPYSNICPITGFSTVTITDVDAESHIATVTVALGQTVYGGTLDLTSGELTVTHAIVDIGDITWNLAGSGSEAFFWYNITDKSNGSAVISTCYEYVGKKSDAEMKQAPTGVIAITNNYDVKVKDLRYNTAAAFQTALTGQKILYELATPTTTTLTAEQLEMVKGYNRISANSGNIEVTAYTGNTWN